MDFVEKHLENILKNRINDEELRALVRQDLLQYSMEAFSDKVYLDVFDNAPVSSVIFDFEFKAIKLNKHAKKLFVDEAPFYLRQFIHMDSLDIFDHYVKNSTNNAFSLPIHVDLVINEDKKHVKLITSRVNANYIQCAIIDESFEQSRLKEIEFLGFRDYLTGLYNRRFFQEEMARLDTQRNHPIGLIMADVNGLKLVNDAFGHHHGDNLIKAAASVIDSTCRSDDIVARIGGDEFAIILPNTDAKEVDKMMTRLKRSTKNCKIGEIDLSISFGAATKKLPEESFEKLFNKAEDQMYKEKLITSTSQRVDVIHGILATLHEKHPSEKDHSSQVSNLMYEFGEVLGFDHSRLNLVKSIGLLHDIGKIAIDYTILEQNRLLTHEEKKTVEKHSEIGYRILKSTVAFADIADIILSHHERIDGHGYPRGLVKAEIPFEARMVVICDSYAAMTSDRAFRVAFSREKAVSILREEAGKQFDELLVDIFIDKVINVNRT